MVDVQWQKSKKTRNVQSFGHKVAEESTLIFRDTQIPIQHSAEQADGSIAYVTM